MGEETYQYELFPLGNEYEYWSLKRNMHGKNEVTDISVGIAWNRHLPQENPFRVISMTAKVKPSEFYDEQKGLNRLKFWGFSMTLLAESIDAFVEGLELFSEIDVPIKFEMDGKRSFNATIKGKVSKFYSNGKPNLKVELTTDRTSIYFNENKRMSNWDPPKKPYIR